VTSQGIGVFKAVLTGIGLTVGLIVLAINGTISVGAAIVAGRAQASPAARAGGS
jgi:hypothetical protein